MTKDDIISMAREAGFGPAAGWHEFSRPFERFAALVAAAEREAITSTLLSLGALEDGEFIMAIRAREQN